MRLRTLLAALVAATLLAACGGDDDDDSAPTDGGEIVIEADSEADRSIGEDLVAYLDRNLEATPEEQESFEAACGDQSESSKVAAQCEQARAVLDAFGSIDAVEVADGTITIKTGIEPGDDAASSGQALCDLIQGADVADFQPGNRVLGAGDVEVAACVSR